MNNWSQRRQDSCFKVTCLLKPCRADVQFTECKQKPEAFVWCWVWRLARCLVNRDRPWKLRIKLLCSSMAPTRPAMQSGFDRSMMFVHSVILVFLYGADACEYYAVLLMRSTQSIMHWVGHAHAVDFYANTEWKLSHAGLILNWLYCHCQLDMCTHRS